MTAKRINILLCLATSLSGLLLAVPPAKAMMQVKWRIQGGYYIIQVYPDLNYPVDCQVGWQVTTQSGFTRQGNSYGNNLSGKQWNEFMGPMTQDVTGIYPSANCQLSQQERDRRAQIEAHQRAEKERQEALERQRQAQEQARQRVIDEARQAAAKKQADEESRRAHTLQVPNYKDVIEKNEAARREQLRQRQQADEAARREQLQQKQQAEEVTRRKVVEQQKAQQQERQRQNERIRYGQEISAQADGISQQLRQQAGTQDAAISGIASGSAIREQGMSREANQAVQSQSDADIHRFLQQRLDTGQ